MLVLQGTLLGDLNGKFLDDLGQCWISEANLCTYVHSNRWQDDTGKQKQETCAAHSFTHFRNLLKHKVI